jgi:hypothetical protein
MIVRGLRSSIVRGLVLILTEFAKCISEILEACRSSYIGWLLVNAHVGAKLEGLFSFPSNDQRTIGLNGDVDCQQATEPWVKIVVSCPLLVFSLSLPLSTYTFTFIHLGLCNVVACIALVVVAALPCILIEYITVQQLSFL